MKNEIVQIAPSILDFDLQNPRIAEFDLSAAVPESEILKVLWEVMDVKEIVLSIKASNFFTHEPLIAIRNDSRYVVIEGNRRLAAVKLLLDNSIAAKLGGNLNLFETSEETLESLRTLPVIVVEERRDAWKFIGFKHINGPQKWGSYAKAVYIQQIKDEFNIPITEIAEQIGDTHKTAQKLYQGIQVINQAEKFKVFDRSDIYGPRLFFSHLYTALGYEGYKDYLGITDLRDEEELPVPAEKKEELGNVMNWLFGKKSSKIEPLIKSQNPDLRRLEKVLKSRESLHAINDGMSLSVAYELSLPRAKTFQDALFDAKAALQKAQQYQTEGFDGKDTSLIKTAGTIAAMADDLYVFMEQKRESISPSDKKTRKYTED